MATMRKFPFISLLVFSCFYLQVYNGRVSATDTLFQGQNMTASGQLTSYGNAFELGFFSLGSTNVYLVIRMKNVATKDIVWVANRDLPFTGSSTILTINDDGCLVIANGRATYRVSDDPSSSQNVSATLLDSGNLVLRDGNMDILWQSFDYPSNTFLPGMKFGYNNKTGKVWSLTSWLDQADPNKGNFVLKMDPKKSNGVFLMRGTEILWMSGPWNGYGFAFMPEMLSPYIFNYFNYSMYSDENETYFSYSVYNSSVITRFIIDVTGHMRELVWFEESQQWMSIWSEPRQFCEVLNSCGPFSSCSEDTTSCRCLRGFYPSGKQQGQDGGCMRRVALTCGNGDNRDMFFRMNDVRYPVSSTQKINSSYNFPSGPQVSNSDAKACREACLSNCTCSAYAYNTSGLCLRWYGDILGLEQLSAKDPNGRTIFIKLAASEFDNGRGANWYLWIIAIPIVLLVFLPSSYIVIRRKKRFKNKGDREDPSQDILLFDMEMSITTSSSDFSGSENPRKRKRKDAPFPLFSFDSVSLATDNFSSENKLGEGGFGPVYKGKLLNGQEIAVKRLSKRSGQGLEELKNETMLIAKLQHRNLVRLLGCCLEQGEKILIYEFMPNKSLDSFLFGSNSEGLLDWGTRVRIIEGIAQGLLYLHQFSRLRIIHRDPKASNILLDGEMNPKISDFGLARMFGGDKLQANTNRIVGTYGYMSPEYAMEGLFSIKSDVFSFGVLLLEIVSGKKSTGFYHSSSLNLIGHAWELWKGDRVFELMDPKLEDQVSYPMVYRYINVALLCVQEMAADRPTMSEVVSMLTNELTVLNSPKKPAFSNARSTTNSSNQPEKFSVNDVTVSLMEPR
ncbi:hypothetical protein E1A91_A04G028700v1 [Gossypium mustelinum]|uniref:Receptor-like serine/threonine-protein kinase n=2 Tax=Gossypium TaxID=3633 RepID=A0A5D2ZMH8_GOSMU|nr:hypothetical protein E1A91_A04G028700v1 [Gossypium mustelinum]